MRVAKLYLYTFTWKLTQGFW